MKELGNHKIGIGERPYIIAEVGVNHEGSLDKAKELIENAKLSGASAVKFQTYKAEKIAIKNSPAYWDRKEEPTSTQYELFKKHDKFGEKEFVELKLYCDSKKIDFLSTPFDSDAVELLDDLCDYFKVSSSDINNIPLLRQIGSKGKPVVISTGCSNEEEISTALKILLDSGATYAVPLHCVLNYPTLHGDANLARIMKLREFLKTDYIGYSDHTLPDETMEILTSAWLMGAVVIEKHFTHNKSLKGNDHYHSMDASDLAKFNHRVNNLISALGNGEINSGQNEFESRKFARRSIVARKAILAGEVISSENVIPKRPGTGISVSDWDKVVGKKVVYDIAEDQQLSYDDLSS